MLKTVSIGFFCMTVVILLAGGCTPTGSAPSMDTGNSQKTLETTAKSRTKRADTTAQDAALGQREALAAQRQDAQKAAQEPKIFEDFATGLTVTYQHPWYIVHTDWKGPIFGKDGKPYMNTVFTTLTKDKSKSAQPGFIYATADTIANGIVETLQTLTFQKKSHKPQKVTPMDVLLTEKAFPKLKVDFRYRGNDGRSIIQECSPKHASPQTIYVYHVFQGEKVASFAMYNDGDKALLDEMVKIALLTR